MREKQYHDSELANKTKIFLKNKLYLKDKDVSQQGNTFYFGYLGEEYSGVYHSKGEKRYFSLHIENPINNTRKALEDVLSDKAVLKKGNIWRFKELFSKVSLEESSIIYGEKSEQKVVPTIALTTEIIDIPLGKKGHLSDNFFKYNFDYTIAPFLLTVHNHKKTLNSK